MPKSAINQFDTTPGNNTDVDGVGVGASMTVDNTNDAFQHLMALIAQQMGEVGALSADIASAATTDLSAARGWFVNITGTNTISAFGTVPAGKIFRLCFVNGLTITHNTVSMIMPNATSFAAAAGDIVTMLSLGTGNWRFVDYSPAGGAALPTGSIVDFGGTTAPTGWLLCNNQAVSRTGYPLLFATIGTLYGGGDGSTTFNVPDFRGRVGVGNDTMGGITAGRITGATISTPSTNGGGGGAERHALGWTENGAHYHNQQGTFTSSGYNADHYHSFSVNSGTASANHTHTVPAGGAQFTAASGGIAIWAQGAAQTTSSAGADHYHNVSGNTGLTSNNHTHTVSISGGTDTQGSGTPHNNMPPALVVMKIIKF